MAAQIKVGRNDRCPCGSGKKYKNCCADKTARKMSPLSWAAIVALVAAAGVLVALVVNAARGGGTAAAPGSGLCPPGQVWDATHGHCH
jgi:hypothetical protein